MILVGPSLGAAVAIDFAVNYPEAVSVFVQMSSLSNNMCARDV
jgi:homoserine acetyltransferase